MSQFSQFSNIRPSSLYESDLIDPLANFESDSISIIAGSSSNQQTTALTPVSEFIPPPTLPSTLECFGPDRKKLWVKYTEMYKDDFIIWWLQTECSTKTRPNQRRMRWDTKYSANIWQHFDQVAHYITSEPMVMCQRCGKTLLHPQQTANGTNSMKHYFTARKCIQAGNSATRQQILQQTIEYVVYIKLLFSV